jgi:oligopeptide/dipeptide ABC transporter ATP-binding protein
MFMSEDLLVVKNLKKHFVTSMGTVKAVDDVSFTIGAGETFGLVGESGSGKSTTAFTIMGIYPPTDGEIHFQGKTLKGGVKERPKALKKDMQMVFQDPGSSLNPRRSVRDIIELPLAVNNLYVGERKQRLEEIMNMVGLPTDFLDRHPRQLGGGEKQLVAISRDIATEPSFITLDEPTSALDVSMQAKIINTLIKIQKDYNISYLFITHNLSLMRNVATRVGIMYLGKLLEVAPSSEFFSRPIHPYTKMLISSIPVITEEEERLKPEKIISRGEIPSPVNVPSGCAFNTRCSECFERCRSEEPKMVEVEDGHFVKCHLFSSKAQSS